jgi:cytochrome c553
VRLNATALAVAFFFAASGHAADPNLCAACHGVNGSSTNPQVPSIAGQPEQFIAMALYQFREGNRKDDQMTPMAKPLKNAEMNELAKFFAAQKAAPSRHQARPESAQAGPALADKYNCSQCHGRQLLGQQHIPRIAGQQFEYLRAQLKAFKAQTRADFDGNMTAAIQAVPPQDLETLADYLAGLEAN